MLVTITLHSFIAKCLENFLTNVRVYVYLCTVVVFSHFWNNIMLKEQKEKKINSIKNTPVILDKITARTAMNLILQTIPTAHWK